MHLVSGCLKFWDNESSDSLIINPVPGDERALRHHGPVIALLALFIVACLFAVVAFAYPDKGVGRYFIAPQSSPASLDVSLDAAPFEVKPVSDPDALNPVDAATAQQMNALMPIGKSPNPAAQPLIISLADSQNWVRSIDCMTAAVYYEAAMEPVAGQRAVAQVILNRVRDPAFPKNVCGVVFEGFARRTGCQFSFTCDGSLSRKPSVAGWSQARVVASQALGGYVNVAVGYSTHYHADYVSPYWAPKLVKTAVIGAHIFYRWPGRRGGPAVINASYAGAEPSVFGQDATVAGTTTADGSVADPFLNANAPPVSRTVLNIDGGSESSGPTEAQADAAPAQQNVAAKRQAGHRWVIGAAPVSDVQNAPPVSDPSSVAGRTTK